MADFTGLGRVLARAVAYPAIPTQRFFQYWARRKSQDLKSRVQWLKETAIAHRNWINLQVRVKGEVPRGGLVVSNHVSYLDIVALSSIGGFAFVSKKEVASWPLFGTYARCGGTIFVDRERRGAVGAVTEEMRSHLDAGVPVVLFPEGTSTDGSEVLPFRSSLLEPIVQLNCPVTPCGLRYMLPGDGDVGKEVAYWGDMTLGPHLLNLMRKRGIILEVTFGKSRLPAANRKLLALDLHREVRALAGICCPIESRVSESIETRGALGAF